MDTWTHRGGEAEPRSVRLRLPKVLPPYFKAFLDLQALGVEDESRKCKGLGMTDFDPSALSTHIIPTTLFQ